MAGVARSLRAAPGRIRRRLGNMLGAMRMRHGVAIIVGVFLVAQIVPRVLANGTGDSARIVIDEPSPGTTRHLVVLLHAYESNAADLSSVRTLASRAFPGSTLLLPEYPAGTFSNADPTVIADLLDERLDAFDRKFQYDSITLIGHSLGSLILRKAYLLGHGTDLASDRGAGVSRPLHPWVRKVDRIVMLSGLNRGWG